MVGKNGVYHIITEAMAPLHDYLRLWWWNCELPDRRQCKTWWTLVICTLKKTGSGLLGYKRCWKQTFYCLITFRFPVSLYLRVALQSNAERCWGLSCLKTVWTCLDLGIATDLGVHLSSVLHHFHHIDAPCRYWRLDSGIGFTLLEWHKVTPPCFGWPVFSSNTIRFGQARPDCCGRWGWGHAFISLLSTLVSELVSETKHGLVEAHFYWISREPTDVWIGEMMGDVCLMHGFSWYNTIYII